MGIDAAGPLGIQQVGAEVHEQTAPEKGVWAIFDAVYDGQESTSKEFHHGQFHPGTPAGGNGGSERL